MNPEVGTSDTWCRYGRKILFNSHVLAELQIGIASRGASFALYAAKMFV